jgi:hypothetical protein
MTESCTVSIFIIGKRTEDFYIPLEKPEGRFNDFATRCADLQL